MNRFLGSKATIIVLLVSILVLVLGISVVRGAGSGSGSAATGLGRVPSAVVDPARVERPGCTGNVTFDVIAGGFEKGDVVLISVRTTTGQIFVGAGFPDDTGGFVDDVTVPVTKCGVVTMQVKRGQGGQETIVSTPVLVVEKK
ncbi:MAG: hypothetical protein FJ320_04125 [SAR202 cluster bacterium]|nr:hypothetical protein [SAR202 cluster bacterium]